MRSDGFRRDISKLGLLFISFTAIFGSGWLFAPLYAAQIAGPRALIAWCVGAIMSAIVGITMAEVVTLYPKVGGVNLIAQETHGRLLGMLVSSLTLLVCLILPSLEVRAVIQYLASRYSFLMTPQQEMTFLGYGVAAVLLVIINLVNLYGSRITSLTTSLSVIFKLIAPAVICISFVLALRSQGRLNHSNLEPFFPIHWREIFLAISTSGIIFSFNGFNQATLFAGEAKDPQKSIPFAILGSILLSAVLYLIIQYVFLMAIPSQSLSQGWKALSFAGDTGPFAGIALLLGLQSLIFFIYADAIVSPLGTAFTYASAAPRMFYAWAENASFFPILKKMNKHGVPFYSVFLSYILGFLVFVFLPSLKAMISILVAAFVLCYTTAPASLLSLRVTNPKLHRPFQVKYPKILCYLSVLFSNIMVFCCGWISLRNLLFVLIISGLFALVFQVKKRSRDFKNTRNEVLGCLWFVIQTGCLGLICFLEEKKLLTFEQCLVLIAVLSLFVLGLSQLRVRLHKN